MDINLQIYTCSQSDESMQTCKEVRPINKTQQPKKKQVPKTQLLDHFQPLVNCFRNTPYVALFHFYV